MERYMEYSNLTQIDLYLDAQIFKFNSNRFFFFGLNYNDGLLYPKSTIYVKDGCEYVKDGNSCTLSLLIYLLCYILIKFFLFVVISIEP
jgi:hypothetical protein